MRTPEESNAAMRIIEKLQHAYATGEPGLPPGADWVDSAFAYIDHNGVYDDEGQITQLLEGYGILVPPPPPPPSFDEMIDLPEWWEGVKAFVAGEFSSENPDFIDAVRSQSMSAPDIYATFVKDDAARQVNISAAQRREIDAAFADGADGGYDVLHGAYGEIIALCRRDSYPRYLASQGLSRGG